jgi:hypothetical protein
MCIYRLVFSYASSHIASSSFDEQLTSTRDRTQNIPQLRGDKNGEKSQLKMSKKGNASDG